MKTLVIISDLHAGSVYGLTTPRYRLNSYGYQKMQKEAWDEYIKIAKQWEYPDVLLVNGDCIDGTESKSGGAELITTDRNVQSDIAVGCINQFKAKEVLMTFGTPYHTGTEEDFEYNIANTLRAKIEGRLFFKMEGLTIDARHKIGSSGVPHGRATSLMREMVWNLINDAEPKADIIVRSHVHYHVWVETPKCVMFTTPSLQLSRGRFGSRQCTGETHWGAIRLTLHKGQIIRKEVVCRNLIGNRPSIIKIK